MDETPRAGAYASAMHDWKTTPDLPSVSHMLRTMSNFLGMAATDAESAAPGLTETELDELAAAVDGVIAAIGNVVHLDTHYPALRVLEARPSPERS